MIRVFLTIVLPLLLPTFLYVLWLVAARRTVPGGAVAWRRVPWTWLALAGLALAVGTVLLVSANPDGSVEGIYVPPHVSDGRVVPGHVEPRRP